MATRVQILDEAVCISQNSYTLWKGVNLIIPPLAIDKLKSRQISLTFFVYSQFRTVKST